MRVPLGYVCYFGVPEGDTRFTYPNLPSFNFPGVTGWPVLPVDARGFRVRGAIAPPAPPAPPVVAGAPVAPAKPAVTSPPAPVDPLQGDPDTSTRWASQERIDGSRRFVALRFPTLAKAPLIETRSCHYESSVNQNFIIDRLPDAHNVWIAGVGQTDGRIRKAEVTASTHWLFTKPLGPDFAHFCIAAYATPTRSTRAGTRTLEHGDIT